MLKMIFRYLSRDFCKADGSWVNSCFVIGDKSGSPVSVFPQTKVV